MKAGPLIMQFCPEPFLWLQLESNQKGVELQLALGKLPCTFMYNVTEI